jgi:hypothetical protein
MDRVDQCVAPAGLDVNVLTTTASTWSSVTVRGTPDRCSSARPFNRFAPNRARHLPTVAWLQPSSRAATWFVLPAAQASTILDRNAKLCGLFGRRAQRPSVSRLFLAQHQRSLRSTTFCHAHPHRCASRTRPAGRKFLPPTIFLVNLRIRTLADHAGLAPGRASRGSGDDAVVARMMAVSRAMLLAQKRPDGGLAVRSSWSGPRPRARTWSAGWAVGGADESPGCRSERGDD